MKYQARPGETPLDDLSGLKLRIPNITRTQLDEEEAKNILLAIRKYRTRKKLKFDLKLFAALHREMFSHVWEWAGHYRTAQTNIGSPPERIAYDLMILERELREWPAELESGAKLHHRTVQIHPFTGGNGRWARLLSDLWLRQEAGTEIIWPEGLAKESPLRTEYLKALQAADGLDYGPLLEIYNRLRA